MEGPLSSPSETAVAFNGHSMVAPLKRVLVSSPRTAGWNQPEQVARWRELGFHHAPDFSLAQAQHEVLCRELELAGAEVIVRMRAEMIAMQRQFGKILEELIQEIRHVVTR